MLRTVRATRYVTPLREGGSLPALVEADDLGLYVLKFRGAGQGTLALVAELVAGEVGRLLGLPVPELVFVDLDPALGKNEPDEEIRDLLNASVGLNLAMDFLPGSLMFNPAARDQAPADLASRTVWFDAFITNVDRTVRNPNLLIWHRQLQLIDHGAALYFHHNWPADGAALQQAARTPFAPVRNHLLLPWADQLPQIAAELTSRLTPEALEAITAQIPAEWLRGPASVAGYNQFLQERLNARAVWEEEAVRARTALRL